MEQVSFKPLNKLTTNVTALLGLGFRVSIQDWVRISIHDWARFYG